MYTSNELTLSFMRCVSAIGRICLNRVCEYRVECKMGRNVTVSLSGHFP